MSLGWLFPPRAALSVPSYRVFPLPDPSEYHSPASFSGQVYLFQSQVMFTYDPQTGSLSPGLVLPAVVNYYEKVILLSQSKLLSYECPIQLIDTVTNVVVTLLDDGYTYSNPCIGVLDSSILVVLGGGRELHDHQSEYYRPLLAVIEVDLTEFTVREYDLVLPYRVESAAVIPISPSEVMVIGGRTSVGIEDTDYEYISDVFVYSGNTHKLVATGKVPGKAGPVVSWDRVGNRVDILMEGWEVIQCDLETGMGKRVNVAKTREKYQFLWILTAVAGKLPVPIVRYIVTDFS